MEQRKAGVDGPNAANGVRPVLSHSVPAPARSAGRPRCRVPRGVLTGAFFILYAVLRIVCEFFREPDSAWSVGWISAGQFLSIFMVFIGAAFLVWGWRTKEYERVFRDA